MLRQVENCQISFIQKDILLLTTTTTKTKYSDRPDEKNVVMVSIVQLHEFDKSNEKHYSLVNPFISDEVSLRTIISIAEQEKRNTIWPLNTTFLIIKVEYDIGDSPNIPAITYPQMLTQLWQQLLAIRDPLLKAISPTIKYTILQKRLLQKAQSFENYYNHPSQILFHRFRLIFPLIILTVGLILLSLMGIGMIIFEPPQTLSEVVNIAITAGTLISSVICANNIVRKYRS